MFHEKFAFVSLFPLLIPKVSAFLKSNVDEVGESETEKSSNFANAIDNEGLKVCFVFTFVNFKQELLIHIMNFVL